MNSKILLIPFIIAGFSSCSTAYKTAQTPDDVYFSPAPPRAEYVNTENKENKKVNEGGNVYQNTDDIVIGRNIHNRRWRRYHSYDYGYGSPYGYYPYGNAPVYVDPKTGKTVKYSGPRKVNLGTYTAPASTTPSSVIGSKTGTQPTAAPIRTFSSPVNNGSGVGNLIRKMFSGSGNHYDSQTSSRTFESKNSSSSNSHSSGGSKSSSSNSSGGSRNSSSSAPVRTFPKK
ncbi:MAG: hypothetical protein ABJA57_11625 [Ginsengibacter sp.]